MYINCDQKEWTDALIEIGQNVRAVLSEVLTEQERLGASSRDASLLIAQFVLSNAIHETLKLGETSAADLSLIKKTILRTCCSQLDKRTNVYTQISQQLAAFQFIDQIPLHLLRKTLGIASGLEHKQNDQFLNALLQKLNSLKISTKNLLTKTPSSPIASQMGLNFDTKGSSPIRSRKSRTQQTRLLNA
jgi:hypothetical protein